MVVSTDTTTLNITDVIGFIKIPPKSKAAFTCFGTAILKIIKITNIIINFCTNLLFTNFIFMLLLYELRLPSSTTIISLQIVTAPNIITTPNI